MVMQGQGCRDVAAGMVLQGWHCRDGTAGMALQGCRASVVEMWLQGRSKKLLNLRCVPEIRGKARCVLSK